MLTRQQGYVMCSLCYGPAHGYALAKRAMDMGDKNFQIAPAQIYKTLRNLAAQGLVSVLPANRYAITTAGLGALAEVTYDNEHYVACAKAAMQQALNTANKA